MPSIFNILVQARDEQGQDSLRRAKLLADRDKRVIPEDKLHRILVEALKVYRTHYLQTVEIIPHFAHESEMIQQIDGLLTLLGGPVKTIPKLPRGHGKSAAADKAGEKLKNLGLPINLPKFRQALETVDCWANPRNLREALLMAVGLIPYRTPKNQLTPRT